MKYMELTDGSVTILDDEDFEKFGHLEWHLDRKGKHFYARRRFGRRHCLLHRLIMDPPIGKCVDHKNGNTLDNRRENLRVCTVAENFLNRRKTPGCKTSPFKGVRWFRGKQKSLKKRWVGVISYKGKTYYLGYFATQEEAAAAYNVKAVELHGEFACLNEIPSKGY